jgi:Flp pilus assembly protein TadD
MSSEKHISRNQACPCGSGIKYKKCCGSLAHNAGASPGSGPTHQQQLYTEAETLRNAGQYEMAKRKYEEILRFASKEAPAVTGLGLCLINLGQADQGLEALRRAVSLAPDELACINHLIVNLFNRGKVEESLKWSKRAVKLGPEGAKANVMVANCYEKLHRIDEALEANRLAQIANPQINYLKLQEAKLNARNGDYERARSILREATRGADLEPEVKTQMLGELGRVLDKLKNYDEAYQVFAQRGHEASRNPKVQKFKLATRPGLINAYIEGLTEERLEKWKPEDVKDDSWTPTFLVGFPRSGTTMTEQILAAHSGIITTDEHPYLEHVRYEWARIVGAKPDLGWMADQLDVETILQLRRLYREKVEADQETPIGSKIIIDKLPLNIMHIGLINLVFPDAKVIVALRDPRDSCLSCFMQDFEFNSAMIHFLALDRTVQFYTQVMGSWLHFRDIITLSHLTIRYEDTVQNLEFEAKRLFGHLGLDWEPEVLEFHQRAKKRVILTPSYVAVTEPVHTRAIGRWKNYQEQFASLLPTLEPFIKEFGYED